MTTMVNVEQITSSFAFLRDTGLAMFEQAGQGSLLYPSVSEHSVVASYGGLELVFSFRLDGSFYLTINRRKEQVATAYGDNIADTFAYQVVLDEVLTQYEAAPAYPGIAAKAA